MENSIQKYSLNDKPPTPKVLGSYTSNQLADFLTKMKHKHQDMALSYLNKTAFEAKLYYADIHMSKSDSSKLYDNFFQNIHDVQKGKANRLLVVTEQQDDDEEDYDDYSNVLDVIIRNLGVKLEESNKVIEELRLKLAKYESI